MSKQVSNVLMLLILVAGAVYSVSTGHETAGGWLVFVVVLSVLFGKEMF